MRSLWDESEASRFTTELELRAYSARLLGRDRSLVLHGGGNASVKLSRRNIFGEEEDLLLVKGSGADMASIGPAGFVACRLKHLLRLSQLPSLSDIAMAHELKASMIDHRDPIPSVEAILHAIIPAKFVDHTHADALISVMNSPHGQDHLREIFGPSLTLVPYAMPGFKLAKLCAEILASGCNTTRVILLHHGVFTSGETARESYELMTESVRRAEDFLAKSKAWTISWPSIPQTKDRVRLEIATLRHDISSAAGRPMVLVTRDDDRSLGFARRKDVAQLSQRGAPLRIMWFVQNESRWLDETSAGMSKPT